MALSQADLSRVKLFQGLPDRELRQISSEMKEITHGAGHVLTTAGGSGVAFSVIIEGEADVKTVDGRTRRLGPSDHFGEMALLDESGRSADVVAVTDVRLAVLAEWGFKQFLAAHPEVSWRLLQALSRRLREAEAG